MTQPQTTLPEIADFVTMEALTEWLGEAIERAFEDANDNHGYPNSFGSGYDQGYHSALKAVRDFLNGDENA